jgi:hypothetical protein
MSDKTNVKKYYNPHTYPVQLAISELNLILHVPPREFVKDTRNAPINDPILDRFVGPQGLQPELSSAPVDVTRLVARVLPPVSRPGYVVGQGHRDALGKWVPPTAASVPPAPQAESTLPSGASPVSVRDSIQGMSIADAKRLGFIGTQRIVPEDFGADETTGSPPAGRDIPPIRVSMEAKPRALGAQGAPLPAQLTEGIAPQVAPILASMAQVAQQNPDAVPSLAQPAAEAAVSAQQGVTGVQALRENVARAKAAVAAAAPARRVAEVVAPAPVRTVATPGPVSAPLPPPQLDPPPPPPPTGSAMEYKCGGCGKTFKSETWLRKHIEQKHRDRLQELAPHAPV